MYFGAERRQQQLKLKQNTNTKRYYFSELEIMSSVWTASSRVGDLQN